MLNNAGKALAKVIIYTIVLVKATGKTIKALANAVTDMVKALPPLKKGFKAIGKTLIYIAISIKRIGKAPMPVGIGVKAKGKGIKAKDFVKVAKNKAI